MPEFFKAVGRWLHYRYTALHNTEYDKMDALLQELAYGIEAELELDRHSASCRSRK